MRIFYKNIKASAGFTLIEILVVLMIVGIAVGGVSSFFTQGSPDQELNKTLERFVVIGDHIADLAVLSGEPIGMYIEPPQWRDNPLDEGWRYSWYKQTIDGPWAELADVPAVEIDNKIELKIFIDQQEWDYQEEEKPKEVHPILVFYPSGEVSPFEIEFTHDDLPGELQTIMVDLWGAVVWKQRQELEEELAKRQ